jgi:hypothetical protein
MAGRIPRQNLTARRFRLHKKQTPGIPAGFFMAST